MIGIYKFTNKINQKVYIGQSVNIERRVIAHRTSAYNPHTGDYNSKFHQAIRKYGFDNFDFEVLINLKPEKNNKQILNQLEIYFIEKYDSFKNGYNATLGGDGVGIDGHKGSSNGRALLDEEEVKYIRECYNAHIPFRQVYQEFQNKISKRGLQKIWYFENWKDILPEYNTPENKYWHSHNAKANLPEVARNNKRQFSEQQVKEMRVEYRQGKSVKEIWQVFAPDKAISTVRNILTYKTYKDIE